MGLFRKKRQPEPEPVRPDQVRRLVKLLEAEHEEILYDAPGNRDYARARALLDAAVRNSTKAELRAANRKVFGP